MPTAIGPPFPYLQDGVTQYSGQVLENLDPVMKEIYEPMMKVYHQIESPVVEGLPIADDLGDIGKQVRFPVAIGANERGVQMGAELRDMPFSGANEYADQTAWTKFFFATLSLSGETMKFAAQGNASTLVNEIEEMIESTMDAYSFDMRRQAWNPNADGVMETVVSVAADVVTVNDAQWFRRGMFIDVYSPTGSPPTKRAGVQYLTAYKILSVDIETNTFVVDDDNAIIAGDFIYRAQNVYVDGSVLRTLEITSIPVVIDDANVFQGNDRSLAGNEWARSVVRTAGSNRTLTSILLMSELQAIKKISGHYPEMMACSNGTYRAMAKMLDESNQTTVRRKEGDGYAENLMFEFGGHKSLPFTVDQGVGDNLIYGLSGTGIQKMQAWPAGFESRGNDGKYWQHTHDNKWAYSALYTEAMNLICRKAKRLSRIEAITEPVS